METLNPFALGFQHKKDVKIQNCPFQGARFGMGCNLDYSTRIVSDILHNNIMIKSIHQRAITVCTYKDSQ